MLTAAEIKKFEAQLMKDESRLEEEIIRLEAPTDFGADEDEELENHAGAADGLKNRLVEVQLALAKIAGKKYGVCEKCGEQIEKEVLKAAPESRFCKKDKKGK
jgi:DnaK suppressor protein